MTQREQVLIELPERIIAKIDATGDCWEWTAARNAKGYGRVRWEGSDRMAHRVVWELLVGPIPDGLQVDHLCRVRHCVNPDHLEPVTGSENVRRSYAHGWAAGQRQTHCLRGHEYTEANTYVVPSGPTQGNRRCVECNNELRREARRD